MNRPPCDACRHSNQPGTNDTIRVRVGIDTTVYLCALHLIAFEAALGDSGGDRRDLVVGEAR